LDANTKFDQTEKEMFKTLIGRDPLLATSLGIHDYDHLLPDGTLKAKLEDIEIARNYLKRIEEFEDAELTQERLFDKDLAIDSLKLSLFFDENLRLWSSSPEAPHTLGASLFLLLTREFAPIQDRLGKLNDRIQVIPRFLRDSRERIIDPVELWITLAIQATEGLPHLLEEIVTIAKDVKFSLRDDLTGVSEDATAAISDYKDWLSNKVLTRSRKNFAIGKKNFDKILELRGLGLSSDELLRFAYSALDKEKARLRELALKVRLGATVEDVKQMIKSRHPKSFREALEAYRRSIEASKNFIIERNVFRIPANEAVIVRETPKFMKSLVSTAAIFQPAKFDKDKISIYLITSHQDQKFLEEHNYHSIPNTTVHEAYPGHHLQGCCANANQSLIRLLTPFPVEFVEGWAHYCEEYMKDIGFDDSIEARFEQTIGMIWRATRMILDTQLARGETTFEAAVKFLVEQTGMERQIATIEVNEYAERPSYFLSYYLGKQMIQKLKRDVKEKLGEDFDERKFNDLLLYAGSIPMKYIRRAVQEAFNIRLSDDLL
jgi:hypothetical protein